MLQNTYHTCPSGDICDEVMSACFVNGSRIFRNSSVPSPRNMHVIDLAGYFNTQDPVLRAANPRLCDAVATILSHTSSECVAAFLDPGVREFVYKREVEGRKGGNVLTVRRLDNKIIAGSYRNLGFSLQWSLYVKAGFGATGQWHDDYAAPVAGSTPIVDGVVMWDVFTPTRATSPEGDGQAGGWPHRGEHRSSSSSSVQAPQTSPRKITLSDANEGDKVQCQDDEISPRNAKFALYQSRLLARYLLWDIWVRLEGRYDCKASWEADGEVRELRLKQALVGFGDEE
ncbi:hypothetical protein ACJBU6_09369 [Exserohilum turcicum]